jgi:hypothetical protein
MEEYLNGRMLRLEFGGSFLSNRNISRLYEWRQNCKGIVHIISDGISVMSQASWMVYVGLTKTLTPVGPKTLSHMAYHRSSSYVCGN